MAQSETCVWLPSEYLCRFPPLPSYSASSSDKSQCATPSWFAAKVIIHQTLSVLEDIVENISGESTKSRQICYQSLQESVQVSLALFPAFIHQSGRRRRRTPLLGGADKDQADCLAL